MLCEAAKRRNLVINAILIGGFLLAIVGFYNWVGGGILRLPAVPLAPTATRDAQRLADMGELQKALDVYYKAHSIYPPVPVSNDCPAPYNNLLGLSDFLVPKLIKKIPVDPMPPSCAYNYWYWSDTHDFIVRVHLETIDPVANPDRWCVGALGGNPDFRPLRRCPVKLSQ